MDKEFTRLKLEKKSMKVYGLMANQVINEKLNKCNYLKRLNEEIIFYKIIKFFEILCIFYILVLY